MKDWVLVSAAADRHLELLDISEPTLRRYADLYEMDLVVDRTIMRSAVPASWMKIPLLYGLLEQYEGVLWIDADALFVRYDTDIRPLAKRSWNWVYNEYVEPEMVAPCAGVLALCARSVTFNILDAIWDMRGKYLHHPWWEQAAAYELFGWMANHPRCDWVGTTAWTAYQGQLPREWDSTPADPHPDPIVFHASGIPFVERGPAMQAATLEL